MTALYTATVAAMGDGRNGRIQSTDGHLDAQVRVPSELGGPGGATNPEQLFAAGYAACFHSALKRVAAQEKANASESEVVADVSLHALPEGGYGLAAALEITLPEIDRETAEVLVAKAHRICPYSNATRDNVEVTLTIV
ncbi:organic hydroperoxide resistance protein [Sinomonas sp. JGH33]|uniref:Organic hydroperoxide resistance protein n=1 Tax=Sinomonas terricola TaxID=3110330 RepID=A0ABU5T4Y6_9MICC|nr:organic hydroperoxide resistance protein [Sinomonas sp. JGH33]MEA5454727.1 organic hydroperoxide resistance protein [Sinomonas sp. JGH33]